MPDFGYVQSCQIVSLISTDTHLQGGLNWLSATTSGRSSYDFLFTTQCCACGDKQLWYTQNFVCICFIVGAARWATRDYQRTASVTQMLKDLNWRTLEQCRIDSRLILMYKITHDLVAIPAADYLIPNTRSSKSNHPLAYRQIPTLCDYYKYTFFPVL